MTEKLIVFEGGGYSGCIWEPNAVVIKNSIIEPVIVTGSLGNYFVKDLERGEVDKTKIIMELTRDDKDIAKQLMDTLIAQTALAIAKILDEKYDWDVGELECPHCGYMYGIWDIDINPDIYVRWLGGLAYEMDYICRNCYAEMQELDYFCEEWESNMISAHTKEKLIELVDELISRICYFGNKDPKDVEIEVDDGYIKEFDKKIVLVKYTNEIVPNEIVPIEDIEFNDLKSMLIKLDVWDIIDRHKHKQKEDVA